MPGSHRDDQRAIADSDRVRQHDQAAVWRGREFVDGMLDGAPQLFEMTPTAVRPVANVFQRVLWLGPIADVTARCAFGDQIVDSDVFWAELVGSGFVIPKIVDGAVVNLSFGQRPTRPVGTRLR